jgi:uncharacterized repeat protein (TIGR03803 family)
MQNSSKTKVAALLLSAIWLAPNVGAQAATFKVLHSFAGSSDGASPQTAPVIDEEAGIIFGTTNKGGPLDFGTVYEIHPSGDFYKVLFAFRGKDSNDGAYPSGITVQPSGLRSAALASARPPPYALYGVTSRGGSGFGVLFKLTRAGVETILHRFDSTVGAPNSPLVADRYGNLYGTGETCTAFIYTTAGEVKPLYSFGSNLPNGLAFGPDGHLYGTTYTGGSGSGALYKIMLSGGSIIHNFSRSESSPNGDLWKDAKGTLFGTTRHGSDSGGGAYQYTLEGVKTVLTLRGEPSEGPVTPMGGLVGDSQGYLYGTTKFGGKYGRGTVYKFKPFAAPTVLYSFTGNADGKYPLTGLAIDQSGALYGVTSQGGDEKCNCGTLFKITQ